VTTPPPPAKHGVCLYCGLQSPATSHGSTGECVDALHREIARLSQRLREERRHVGAPDNQFAESARLRRTG
jgi:hypothetical protein